MAKLEKILSLSNGSIQFWLRTVEEQDLLNGLIGVSSEVRQRVLENLSPRAKFSAKEYLESHADLDPNIIEASLTRLDNALIMIR